MFLCADLDAFFVSVEQALNPFLKGKPVIVGGMPGERSVVASASYEARAFGIRSGMPTSQAYRLCPQGLFLRGHHRYYKWYSERFHEILTAFSPLVDMVSIDEAYVDIKGTARLFGTPRVLANALKKYVDHELNIPVSIGIARSKVFSKIACEQSKPDGNLLVAPGYERTFLEPLPVSVLPGIGPKHLAILHNLNIKTVKELLEKPDWVIETALGNYHKILKFFISGGDYHSRDGIKSISRGITLSEDTFNRELLYALLLHLIERGCTALRQKGFLAKIVTVKIRYSDFKTASKRTMISPTNAQQVIFECGIPLLEELLKEKKRVRLINIALSGLEEDGLQPSLFRVREERLNRLNYALDKTRERFGTDSVFPASTITFKKDYTHAGIS
jgi:DNA polymerase-4